MEKRTNRRVHDEHVVKSQHLKLIDLIEKARRKGLSSKYLYKENIPASPQPEFHVSHLKHDTNQTGLRGIKTDEGFRNPGRGSLLWWSLAVGPDEIASAERRLLETTFPDRTEEQVQMQQSFLEKFTTSPAFEQTSRLGSYRFTFPLEEVLKAYRQQFCSGAQPVMRVYETVLYKQEVMYVVLIHSPANQERFSKYPLLTDDPNSVCTYKDGCFIWRPQAMSETHRYKFVLRQDAMQMEAAEAEHPQQFYVWDHFAVALHVDKQVLNFGADRLRENLMWCDKGNVQIADKGKPIYQENITFNDFPEAEEFVKTLWPDNPSPLKKPLQLN
ncbi:uncharacterized protein LOC119895192 [Micropterus salmoides]|uniref:uncharacterized protein LOC119895192 n=1 Tax=Micropterus salmoides TaxID=27706 RepID=UPI0018EA730E|nr:uncharacterized protein LOC119895192 [Micropterus salmoides]